MDVEKVVISRSPVLVSYSMVTGSQAVRFALRVGQGQYYASRTEISTTDHLRRHDVECARNGGEEEEESRKDNKIHGWVANGAMFSGREW